MRLLLVHIIVSIVNDKFAFNFKFSRSHLLIQLPGKKEQKWGDIFGIRQ